MTNHSELFEDVNSIFDSQFTDSPGTAIPTVDDITFDNEGKSIKLAMLFIDIKSSTHLVASVHKSTAAKMYKSFLKGITKIVNDNDGEVRSFNGDGVLVVFCGEFKCDNAIKAAMQMKNFCSNILKPKFDSYKRQNIQLIGKEFNFGIGIHVGDVFVIKGGIGGENNRDLVWVGNPTNFAVKLADFANGESHIHTTQSVIEELNDVHNLWDSSTMKFHNTKISIWMYAGQLATQISVYKTNHYRYLNQ